MGSGIATRLSGVLGATASDWAVIPGHSYAIMLINKKIDTMFRKCLLHISYQ